MAIPTFVATGAKATGTTSATPALPAGIQTNDILLLIAECSALEAVTIPTPNGGVWNQVTGSPQPSMNSKLTVFWSRYNGTQGNPTTGGTTDHICCFIAAWSGCVTSGNPWNITVGGIEDVEDTSLSATGGTTTVADCLVLITSCLSRDSDTAQHSAQANADLTNVIERQDVCTSVGWGGGVQVTEGAKASSGTFGATTVTLAYPSTKGFLTIALKPQGGQTFYQTIPATAIGVSSLGRLATRYRTLLVTAAGIASLNTVKKKAQSLIATAVGVASLIKIATHFRALSATAIGTAVLSKITTRYKTLSVTAIANATILKKMFKTLLVTAVGLATLVVAKKFTRTLAVVAVGSASLSRVIIRVKSLVAGAIGVASLTKITTRFKTLSAIALGNVSIIKKRFESLLVTAVSIVSLAAQFIAGGAPEVVRWLLRKIGFMQ